MKTIKLNFQKSTKNSYPFFILFIFFLALTGCFQSTDKVNSDHVNSEDIHQSYDLFYDGNSNKTDFYGTLRVGGDTGTTVELVSPGKILINNQTADVDRTYGVHYSKLLRDGDVQKVSIQWTTNEGASYLNNFYIPGATFSTNFNFTISLHEISNISADAPGYDKSNETLRLEIMQADINNTMNVISIENYNYITKQFLINPEKLITLKPGPAIFAIVRSSFNELQQKTKVGGNTYIKYRKEYSGQLVE